MVRACVAFASLCNRLWDIGGLFGCGTVTELDLSRCPLLKNISALAGCPQIRSLNLSHCVELAEFSVIKALNHLQYLDVSCNVNFWDTNLIATKMELEQCDLSWTGVCDVSALSSCERLRVVYAKGCLGLGRTSLLVAELVL